MLQPRLIEVYEIVTFGCSHQKPKFVSSSVLNTLFIKGISLGDV